MRPQHVVEYCPIFSFIQVSSPHCDHRRPNRLILKYAGVVYTLSKAWPIVIYIKDCHKDLMRTDRQMKYEDA